MKTVMLPLIVTLACVVGCMEEKKPDRQHGALNAPQMGPDDEGIILVLCLDLSGSFLDLMTKDGKAWDFTCNVVDKYTQGSIDNDKNEIIIAQFSAPGTKPLLWQGSTRSLREEFDSASDFQKFLLTKSHPQGSRILEGLSDVIEFLMIQPGVSKKKIVLLCLSDLLDSTPDQSTTVIRLRKNLKAFAKLNPAVGLYWVDQSRVADWKAALAANGFQNFVVESDIRFNPPLPTFP